MRQEAALNSPSTPIVIFDGGDSEGVGVTRHDADTRHHGIIACGTYALTVLMLDDGMPACDALINMHRPREIPPNEMV